MLPAQLREISAGSPTLPTLILGEGVDRDSVGTRSHGGEHTEGQPPATARGRPPPGPMPDAAVTEEAADGVAQQRAPLQHAAVKFPPQQPAR